jgi:hypothetical protein
MIGAADQDPGVDERAGDEGGALDDEETTERVGHGGHLARRS